LFGRIHRAQSVTLPWISHRIDVVEQCCQTVTQFFTKMVSFYMLVRMGVGNSFSRGGALVDFSKSFSTGAKSGEIWFLPLEIKKTTFFAEVFKFLLLFRHPYACVQEMFVPKH